MKSKLIQDGPQRTFALVFDAGAEFLALIQQFAKEQNLGASQFTGVGAFSEVTLGYFQRQRKSYKEQKFSEQLEVLSLLGDITLKGDGHQVHPHTVLGRPDFTCIGGHVKAATVWPTLEVIITESPAHLQRQHDEESGLALIRL